MVHSHYFLGSFFLESVEYIFALLIYHQERPYHDDSTASRLLSEVKHRRARLVLRWGTTLESRVLFFWSFDLIDYSKYKYVFVSQARLLSATV